MSKNTKVVLIAAVAVLASLVAATLLVIALSPFFNIANIVNGGK